MKHYKKLKSTDDIGTLTSMCLTIYLLDHFEKRDDAADARMGRIEDKLTDIQVTLASLATKNNVRDTGLTITAVVLASVSGVGGLLFAASRNQIASFQTG